MSMSILVQYPSAMKKDDYDPQFAIRGLHCDSKNGVLMKIDAYNHIQLSSVYRYREGGACGGGGGPQVWGGGRHRWGGGTGGVEALVGGGAQVGEATFACSL